MRWIYKTVHYELKKEGLLGSTFIDESEIEESLNEYGKAGWELISTMDIRDGIMAIFKQPFGVVKSTHSPAGEKGAIDLPSGAPVYEDQEKVEGIDDDVDEQESSGIGVIRIE